MFRIGLCDNKVLIVMYCEIAEGIGGFFGLMGFDKDLLGEWYGGVVVVYNNNI